ncbi:MAG: phosphate transport system regulatory protein PhoU [Acidobacteria bacterium 13_1_20CM_3_53_8]|nr:MAG: phosphate transport system regulatory protein PhoU [Acidobacteria bacterium 13_1_20CM_3_53_8]
MEHHRIIDNELEILRDRVLLLGGETETALQRAMYALTERDTPTAHEVLRDDNQIDQMEIEIDRLCVDLIALRQPAARDLRFVISVAKITPILERIADHACNIARVAIDLNDEPRLKNYVDLPRMADVASSMLRTALDAFTQGDAQLARAVIERDDEIDVLYNRIFHDLIDLMMAEPDKTPRGARLLFVAKHIERIGDYVTDICELTVYMAEASIIKHTN